jgi:TRAP-type C4-dicarboxylate transport system substrate-binding protein
MKKTLLFSIVLVLLSAALVFAGGDQEGASGGSQKTIELKYNDFNASGIGITDLTQEKLDTVEELTDGRVKITCYFNGSLVKYPETFQGISTGVADITYYMVGGTPGVHQLNEVFNLPFLGFKDSASAAAAYNQILDSFPELQEENEQYNIRWLAIHPMLPFHLHMTDKIIRTPADAKGEKVLAEGHNALMFNDMGAVAMNLGPGDWYTSLQKKVVTGHFTHFVVPMEFKTDELLKYHTKFGEGGGGNGCVGYLINLDSWSRLSPDDQLIISRVFSELNAGTVTLDIGLEKDAFAKLEAEGGHTIETLSDAEIELWKEAAVPAVENWIKETEEAGYPARKIYNAITDIANE